MRKLCSKWVLRLLQSIKKKTMRRWFRALFATVSMQQKGDLHTYITVDEIYIHHFTPESNRQSAEWTAAGESRPKRPKTQTSAGKFLASVFWDAQGILFIDFLEKGRTINSEYYIVLLVCLNEEIAKKQQQMKKKKCSLTKNMHRVASQSKRWQNYMNCILDCFRTHPILQIWPPATSGCLQTSKECSRERDLAPMKKWYRKLRRILRPKTNSSTKKSSNS